MYEKEKDATAVQFADDVGKEPNKTGGKITGKRMFVVASILATELCERLTYYSVVANMVLFCTSELNFSSDDASVVTLVFSGKKKCFILETLCYFTKGYCFFLLEKMKLKKIVFRIILVLIIKQI